MVIDFHTHMFPDKIADKNDYISGRRSVRCHRRQMEHTRDFQSLRKQGGIDIKYCTSGYDKAFPV